MLRPGSLPRAGPHAVGTSGTKNPSLPLRTPVPCGPPDRRASGAAPRTRHRCAAARRGPQGDDIEDMTMDERLERLSELSGRVGEVRSVFDRESLLRQMGALDPAIYATPPPLPEGEEDLPLEWIPWNDDPRTHVVDMTVSEPSPNGMGHRRVLGRDAGEDEAIISLPLHNCLTVYICEGMQDEDSLERQEAAADFSRMQLAFLERWAAFHGPLPPALVDLLCDFSVDAPPARAKMALWVMWLAEGCGSAYWREVLGGLPQPEEMPHGEFCTDEEIMELQWQPYALPLSVRREALRTFYDLFGASPLAEALGFRRTSDVDPLAPPMDEETAKAAADAAAAAAAAAPPTSPPAELRPLPPFERFLWAYCHAEAHSLGNGERTVFFPQADPCLYTTEPTLVNTTLAVAAHGGHVMDEFAVLVTLRPLQKGERLYAHAPFGEGPTDGGGGATSQLHTQFGRVPESGGNEADLLDLQPETGTFADDWLKRLLGQEAATRLDMVTDPRLRHLLALVESGDADMAQVPPLRQILPPLQIAKLWGPGLVAGVKRIRLDERIIAVPEEMREGIEQSLAEERREAELMAAQRRAAGLPTGGAEEVSYKEYDEWQQDLTEREIVEVPGDISILDTEEGRAEWRRTKAAWRSLPRVPPSDKVHGRCMELALEGAPLEQVFPHPRDITRELAAAESLLADLNRVLTAFPTTIEYDKELLATASYTKPAPAAAATAAASSSSGASRGGKARRGKRSTGSGSESDSDQQPTPKTSPPPQQQQQQQPAPKGLALDIDEEEDDEGGQDEGPPPAPLTAITHPRMYGVVGWRMELKCVWRQMVGIVQEYRDALAVAEATVGAAAGAGVAEPLVT